MAQIACLIPKNEMYEQALQIIEEEKFNISPLKVIATEDAVTEAMKAVEQGANIIVARGAQAYAIKECTKIPIVEITLTAQELGRLIQRAKSILDKKSPVIAIIGFENMLCDTSYFDEIFEITLKSYLVRDARAIHDAVQRAIKDRVDLVIGGDMAVRESSMEGIPTLFLDSTKDSLRQAFIVANKVGYASDLEKQNNAQLETLLDTSFNGLIKVDAKGSILAANRIMEDILKKTSNNLMGIYLPQVITEIEKDYFEEVLNGKREMYSTFIKVKQLSLMVMLAPIKVDNQINGAILSCHKVKQIQHAESDTIRDMYLHGYVAKSNFDHIHRNSKEMKKNIEKAKMFARSENPVLIYGETGTEKEMFAQSIHNNSIRRSGPFISINCNGMMEDKQADILFGEEDSLVPNRKKGVMEIANYGTVLIHEIEQLSLHCQYRLFKAIKYKTLILNDMDKVHNLDVRIIATTKKRLTPLVRKGIFREDLYYTLNGLAIELPSIRENPSDISLLLDLFVKEYSEMYSKYAAITQGARKIIENYTWEGNLIQLESFCERMILTVNRRLIDEDLVNHLLNELYPVVREIQDTEKVVIYKNPEAAIIADLLDKYNGNRTLVAKEMKISTTTLWRHIKKYGVNNRYDM